jgi:hypothetical protein
MTKNVTITIPLVADADPDSADLQVLKDAILHCIEAHRAKLKGREADMANKVFLEAF